MPATRSGFLTLSNTAVIYRTGFSIGGRLLLFFLLLPSFRFIDCAFLGTVTLLSFRVSSGYVGVRNGRSKQKAAGR